MAVESMGKYLSSMNMRRRLAGNREEEEDVATAVLELARTMRAGFAGDDQPQSEEESVVGRSHKDVYFGEKALMKKEEAKLNLSYPIEQGVVQNWDDEEQLLRFAFDNRLGVDPKEHPVLLTETSLNPVSNREKVTRIMFETFETSAFYLANNAVLAAYASGRENTVVLHIDEDVTQVVPIYEGHALDYATIVKHVGSLSLTRYMEKLLEEKGNKFKSNRARQGCSKHHEDFGICSS